MDKSCSITKSAANSGSLEMSTEQNIATVHRMYEEIFNKGNFSLVPELIAPEYIYRSAVLGEVRGQEGFTQMVTSSREAFPDARMEAKDIVAEGDRLAVVFSYAGTFKGKLGNFEPTGKQFSITGAIFYRFSNGRVAEVTGFYDTLAFYQQLGVSPPQK